MKAFAKLSFLALVALLSGAPLARAGTVTSTAAGGAWNTAATWVGGVAPVAGDDVVIATTGAGNVLSNTATNTCLTLTVNSGASLTLRRNLTVTGATSITGTIEFGSSSAAQRTMTFTGDVTLSSGAVWNETITGAAARFSFAGNLVNNATTLTAQNLAAATHAFTGAAKTLSGTTATVLPYATFSGTYQNDGTLTVGAILDGAGTLTQGTSATLNLGGACTITTLAATTYTNTVNYTGAAQTVKASGYSSLVLSGSGAKAMSAGTYVNGNLSIAPTGTATASVAAGPVLGAGSLTLGGVASTPASGTFGGTGSAAANIVPAYFAATAGILFVGPTGTAANLVFSTVPGTGTAGTPFSVTVQSQDAFGNPANLVNATTITLTKATGGGPLTGTLTGIIGSGANSATISGVLYTKSDTLTLTAAASGGDTLSAVTSGNIVFSAAVANAGTSTVSASPTTMPADGGLTSTITVTLNDIYGNPTPGKTVTLNSDRNLITPGTDTISAASGPSSATGVVTFTVKSTTVGPAVFTATDATDSFNVSQTATVTYIAYPLWSGAAGAPWSVASNWSGVAPIATLPLYYAAGGSGSSVNDLVGAAFWSVQFNSGVNAFTLSGNKVILTGDTNGAVVVNNSTNLQTLNLPIQINSSAAVNAANGAVTLGGEVSGAGTLVKSGASTLDLNSANIHTGGTTLSAGTLNIGTAAALGAATGSFTLSGGTFDNTSGGALLLANNKPQNWIGSFTFAGSNDINLGTGAVTLGASLDATVSAKTLTVGGPITGAFNLTKRGTGTLVLKGTGSVISKLNVYSGGTLLIDSGASLTANGAGATLDLVEGSTLRVSSGSFTTPGSDQAHDGQWGKAIVEGTGTITSNGDWLMGRNMGHGSLVLKDNAIMTGTGALRMGRDNIRDNYVGLFNNAQATFGSVEVFPSSMYGEGGFGSGSVLQIADSAKLTATSMTVGINSSGNANVKYGYAQVTQSGSSTVTVNGNIGIATQMFAAVDFMNGTYNLNGGELKVRQINNGTVAIRGTAAFNLHGGKLTYNNTVAQTDFIRLTAGSTAGSGSLYLYATTVIDDNGQAVTVNQAILTPNSGQGLASITVAAPFNNYFMTPEVYISGGGGSGATAIPVLNDAGQVTAITVTNPGLGYTSKPTVQLWYDGNANYTIPDGDITMATNAYTGGLTKQGAGTLTLTGSNTYTGTTKVDVGTLACTTIASLTPTALEIGTSATVSLTYSGTQSIPTLKIGGVAKSPGIYGAVGSALPVIGDSHFTGTGTVTVLTGPPPTTPYDNWVGPFFPGVTNPLIVGKAADPDGDGQNNLMEFALGGTPNNGALNAKVHVHTGTAPEHVGDVLILTIAVRDGTVFTTATAANVTDGIRYTVEGGTNLNTWTGSIYPFLEASYYAGLPPAGTGYHYQSFALSDSAGLPGKGFLRVRVEPLP